MFRALRRRHFCTSSLRARKRPIFNIEEILDEGTGSAASDAERVVAGRKSRKGSFADVIDESQRYLPFREWIQSRREEAKRSLLVQVKSADSREDLLGYCAETFGGGVVKSMRFHRNPDGEPFANFFLLEFESRDTVRSVVSDVASHGRRNGGSIPIPVSSPFMWFAAAGGDGGGGSVLPSSPSPPPPPQQQEPDDDLDDEKKSLDDQMSALHDAQEMTDLDTRLRFMACEQLELALSGMFPRAKVLPFGSSVNSFGKRDSDLDMTVDLFDAPETESRLRFHAKVAARDQARAQTQRYCVQLSGILRSFLPGCEDVQNIPHARVPIVKYRQQLLGLDCDLTMATSGFHMSELLYLCGELDARVRPLVFTVRSWAKEQGLAEDERPTQYFTNFTLALMTIFFLQSKYRMLPPFEDLQRLAGDEDRRECDDGIDCTFIRDVSGLQPELNKHWFTQRHLLRSPGEDGKPPLTLAQMLADFFDFYSHFDFKQDAVCVVSGRTQPKRAASTSTKVSPTKVSFYLDVTNPLERDLNVSANVQDVAVARFQRCCDQSLKKMFLMSAEGEQKLAHILAGEANPKLKVQVSTLGGWSYVAEGIQRSMIVPKSKGKAVASPFSSSKGHHEERMRQERLKKKYLRVPKARQFFDPKI